jgi:hypothetical protein
MGRNITVGTNGYALADNNDNLLLNSNAAALALRRANILKVKKRIL